MSATMAAVDLGASSGRVLAGAVNDGVLKWQETSRFVNQPISLPTERGARLYWDGLKLWQEMTQGLRAAAHDIGPLASVGIDTWAVDYGLLSPLGDLISNVASYRCDRTQGLTERYFAQIPAERLYGQVGLQTQPFNTVFQLLAEPDDLLAVADRLLLLPDLLGYWLTGRAVTEVTNASTTGLLDPRTRDWNPTVLGWQKDTFGRDVAHLLTDLQEPGEFVGAVSAPGLGLTSADGSPTQVVSVGSHDTASAVLAVPAETDSFAYISCGTWSLVGLELEQPVMTEAARAGNLTNELGVDGTVRFLKNVMGLWVFNEACRTWRDQRLDISVPDLVAGAAKVAPGRTVVDIDATEFFAPGNMPERIAEAARRTGQPIPQDPYQITRCIIDSLALAYRRALRSATEAAGKEISVVHMVGGGIQNELLCQLTADAVGLPVVAGPVEGTAMGNLLVQARALGVVTGGLAELREVVRASSELRRYEPTDGAAAHWNDLEHRI